MSRLENLEPALLWKHFIALSAIPRGSKNEAAACQYVVEQAKRLGLECVQDQVGNVLVRKAATPGREKSPVIVLQGHVDMVCEKNEGTQHDFTKDGLKLQLEGEWMKATGTTLGADNGIGAAAALAVMESKEVKHGPLEMLFTIDEETGMTGAFGLSPDLLKGNKMLNLDTEEEGAVYIGCAGGMDSVAVKAMRRVAPGASKSAYRVKVTGLKGGHSGLDIHTGRGNAIKLLARLLRKLVASHKIEIAALDGGSKRNAIPREAFATIYFDKASEAAIKGELEKLQSDLRAELGIADPGVVLQLEPLQGDQGKVFQAEECAIALQFLHVGVHGMLAMTPDIEGLVQTSSNLGIIETRGDELVVSMSHRSSIDSAKKDVGAMVAGLCQLAGFKVEQSAGYPGWKPNLGSELLKSAKRSHAELFGKEPLIKAVHAGLECGLIGEKYPKMEMISFGPTIVGAHSPDERVNVPSVANFWKYLVRMLETF